MKWINHEMDKKPSPNFWQLIVSVLGAIFGVQSSKVRERDFNAGSAWWVYVLIGLVIVLVLVLALVGLAKLVMHFA